MYRSFSVSSSICVDLISLVLLGPESSMKRVRSQNLYVQPRSRKMKSKIGTGIPRSQSKMYPVAPACLILFVRRILNSSFRNFTGSQSPFEELLSFCRVSAPDVRGAHRPFPQRRPNRRQSIGHIFVSVCLSLHSNCL